MTTVSETESDMGDFASPARWPIWQPPPGLPEPAREVWLAGLGAFSRAQAEGGKAFQALVRQGLTLQTQASQVAQERIAEATQPWERLSGLNGIFEDRVARALAHLGLPGAPDWAALQARTQALEAALQETLHAVAQLADQVSALLQWQAAVQGTVQAAPRNARPQRKNAAPKPVEKSAAKAAAPVAVARASSPASTRPRAAAARAKVPARPPARASSGKKPRPPASS